MNEPGTTHTGPLGSTIHVIRADAETIAELATVDWSRHFRRVCLDPVRGLVTLMSPSRLHEDLTLILDDVVDIAGSIITGVSKGLRATRLRGRGEPPGTGMEPDGAFYVGERARGYLDALREGVAVADAFLGRTAPDLVVETELTNADAGKAERYAQMGVLELWRLYGRKGTHELRAEFLELSSGHAPRSLDASLVLEGFTPSDVCEAVDGVRLSGTRDERTEAVARIVRRRRRTSVRVREEEGAYSHIPREPAAADDRRQEPGRTAEWAHHG